MGATRCICKGAGFIDIPDVMRTLPIVVDPDCKATHRADAD